MSIKSNHLCFRCGEKNGPGHMCKKRQLNCLLGTVENEVEIDQAMMEEENGEMTIEGVVEQEIQQEVCLNALTGHNQGENTIFVGGTVKKRQLSILIDLESTHSFIDVQTVAASGYKLNPCLLVRVTVEDGNYDRCNSQCKDFSWKMQGRNFVEELLIIPLGSCALVLGNDWMKRYNPTKFDHERKCVTIGRKSNKLVLPELVKECRLSMISSGAMRKMFKKGQDIVAHLFMKNIVPATADEEVDKGIKEVLNQYSEVFAEPKSLPPVRTFDHSIPLKRGAMPFSLRPYRYNFHKKNKLERHVKEMLTSGVIQSSQCPYSSPALLVKKKD